MKIRSAQECIKRILKDIDKRRNVHPMDYANRNFVRRYNAAMDRIKENATFLWENYPDQRDLFIDMVLSSDYDIASHCANLLYGMKDSSIEYKKLALSVIKKLIDHPDAPELSKLYKRMNVEQWEAELAEEL